MQTGTIVLTDPADAPLGTTVVFPRWQDQHHPREIAIRWAPPFDLDEQHPWLIVGSDGPQVLGNDSVAGCEVLACSLVDACATSSATTTEPSTSPIEVGARP